MEIERKALEVLQREWSEAMARRREVQVTEAEAQRAYRAAQSTASSARRDEEVAWAALTKAREAL